jgi:hypothetical protein
MTRPTPLPTRRRAARVAVTAAAAAAVVVTAPPTPASAGVVEKPLTFDCPTIGTWTWNTKVSYDPDAPPEMGDFGFGMNIEPVPPAATVPIEGMVIELPFSSAATVSSSFTIGGFLRVASTTPVDDRVVIQLTAIAGVTTANLKMPTMAFPARFAPGTAGTTATLGSPSRVMVTSGGADLECIPDPGNGPLFTVTVAPAGATTTSTTVPTTTSTSTTSTSTTVPTTSTSTTVPTTTTSTSTTATTRRPPTSTTRRPATSTTGVPATSRRPGSVGTLVRAVQRLLCRIFRFCTA